ncbi:MAG: ABC transporter ATP-binding protein [Gemmatimonadota bacterium]
MQLYLRILRYLKPYRGLFVASVVAMAVFSALDAFSMAMLIPFLEVLFQDPAQAGSALFGDKEGRIYDLLDQVVGGLIPAGAPMVGLRNVLLILFGIFILKNVALYVELYLVVVIEQRVTKDLRDQIYSHLMEMDLGFFQRTKSGQIISRVTNDVDQLRTLVTRNLARALSNTIQALVFLTFLLLISWQLTLATLIALPLMMGLWQRFRRRIWTGVLKVWDAVGEVSSHIQESIGGIRLVKATGSEAYEDRRFRELTRRQYKATVRNERWRQFFPPANEMIIAAALLVVLWYGSRQVLVQGSLAPGAFIAFTVLAARILSPIKWLGKFPSVVQPGLAAAERAFELLDARPEITDRPEARPVDGFREAIRFERVRFEYEPGEPVLRDVELDIGRGEVVALVGPSGAGKTTIANLVPRFYDPVAGRITLDGRDLRDVRINDLRSLMGIVTQETILFHDTVRANIAYGLTDVTQASLEEAARAAHAHGFIRELPEGYDTVLGERGTRLSGGQRQRIAIARALLRDAPILILDEATSALDSQSEALVQDAIERLMEDRTVLVIAHRLSTVRKADRIVVMRDGAVVDQGTHDELLEREGLYRRLYQLQFADVEPLGPLAG